MDPERSIEELVETALEEDRARNDITTGLLVPGEMTGTASIISRQAGIISGQDCAGRVFRALSSGVVYEAVIADGGRVGAGDPVSRISGPLGAILSGERTALNFLGHLSGVATRTSLFVKKAAPSGVTILDTRKTTPAMRLLEKRAVIDGGGRNHRGDLESYILVKENHISAAGGIEAVVGILGDRIRNSEIEVRSVGQLRSLKGSPPGRVMLDNFTPKEVAEAVGEVESWKSFRPEIEVSGGIDIDNIESYAIAGVDLISVGSITSSAGSLDLSLLVE